MHVGIGQVHGYVLDKQPPRQGKKDVVYYTLTIGDVGWSQRVACNFAVYNAVVVGTAGNSPKYTFTGKLNPVKATRAGSSFPDDMQQLELDAVKDFVAPKASA